MSQLSNYAEAKLLDHVLGTTTYTKPTATYLALFTATPSDTGGGTEVSGNGYARQAVTWNAASSGAGTADNSSTHTFTASGGNWGTITHIAIMDASTTGNFLYYGAVTASRVINDGDSLTVAAGAIVCSLA